jgi:hypothetical protein
MNGKLTLGQVNRARRTAKTDYEVCALLMAYLRGELDGDGIALLAEEVGP